jgi:hypothetical protein
MEALRSDPWVMADAASAALYAWEWRRDPLELARAEKLAATALRYRPGHPAASLVLARIQIESDQAEAAVLTLGEAELIELTPYLRGRYAVAASLIQVQAGRSHLALKELKSARGRGGVSHDVYRAEAWAHLALNDFSAAIDSIEKMAFVDGQSDGLRSPVQGIWYPTLEWTGLYEELATKLRGDLRHVDRERAALGILLWSMGDREGSFLLAEEIDSEEPRRAALGASAQAEAAGGRFRSAEALAVEAALPLGSEPLLLAIRGWAMCRQGDTDGGVALLGEAISSTVQVGAWYRLQVDCQIHAGEAAEALASANLWVMAEPDNMEAVKTRLDLLSQGR